MNQSNNNINVVGKAEVYNLALQLFENIDVSETTRKDYSYRIKDFIIFSSKSKNGSNQLLEYKRFLAKRNDITVSTKNKYLITAKIFLKEMYRNNLISTDLTVNIKSFSQDKKHKKFGLTQSEIEKIYEHLEELPDNKYTLRQKALFTLLAIQGLRQIEIVRLCLSDVNLNEKILFLRGKGQDDKEMIHLHPETVTTLQLYINCVGIKDGYLFFSYSNNRNHNKGLSTRAIKNIITEMFNELDIKRTVHGFRHYFTTKLLKSFKSDVVTVSKFTRHKSLEMLTVYNDNIKLKKELPKYYEAFEF